MPASQGEAGKPWLNNHGLKEAEDGRQADHMLPESEGKNK